MRRFSNVVAAVVGILVLIAGGAIATAYLTFSRGERWSKSLGGNWEIRYVDTPLRHGGPSADLYRHARWRGRRIDELVYVTRYYGDDCLVYETTRKPGWRLYFAVCGDRRPVMLAAEHYEQWLMAPEGFRKLELVDTGQRLEKRPGELITREELKRRAMAAPPFFDDWYK